MSDHKPNYKAIQELNALKDRIDIWIKHNQQPKAYDAPAECLGELAGRLARIAGDVLIEEIAG